MSACRRRLGKALMATHTDWVAPENLQKIILWRDLKAMLLGNPGLDPEDRKAQETGEGAYQWPPEIDPENPIGAEHNRPAP